MKVRLLVDNEGQTADRIIIHSSQLVMFSNGGKDSVSKKVQDTLDASINGIQGGDS